MKPLFLGASTKEQDGLPWGQDYSFSYLVFQPGFLEYVSDQTSSPHMVQWGVIISSMSQHYSYLYTIMSSVCGSRWAVSSMLSGYQPLWWWLASSPEPKRNLGGKWQGVKAHLPQKWSPLLDLIPHHHPPILWWWKGIGTFLWVCTTFVCSLTFPHAMAGAYLMHC